MESLIDFDIIKIRVDDQTHQKIKEEVYPKVFEIATYSPATSVSLSNCGGWQSESMVLDFENTSDPLFPVASSVLKLIEKLTEKMTLREDVSLNLSFQYWLNLNGKGDYNVPHAHSPQERAHTYNLLSGCYYLKKPENSGNIVFPSDRSFMKKWFVDEFDRVVEVEEGDIIIFPDFKTHYVQSNESDDYRLSVAFNVNVQKPY